MRAILSVMCGMVLAGTALAGDLPVAPPSPMATFSKPTTTVPFSQSVSFGGTKVDLESRTVIQMKTAIGVGVVDDMGSAGDHITWLCYDLPETRARVWIWGGESGRFDSLTAEVLSDRAPKSSHCPALPAKFRPIAIDGWLWLGASREALIKHLGAPATETGGWLVFSREVSGSRDEDDRLVVRLENGRVAALWASRETTY